MALVGAQFVNAVDPNPVGSLQAFAGANAPTGWLLCDGSQQPIATYPELYSVLSTTYGALTNGSGGAGTSHFRLPDLRGRMPLGAGNDSTAANNATRTLGTKGGDTRSELLYGNVSHTGAVPIYEGTGGSNWRLSAGATGVTLSSTGGGSTLLMTNNGGTGSGANMPPFLVTNYIIKATSSIPRGGTALGSTPPIVTALPANPQFGEVVTYLADSANGIAWSLQYDATGAYPWKFIGGQSLSVLNGGDVWLPSESTTSLNFVALATATSVTFPLSGDYSVEASSSMRSGGNHLAAMYIRISSNNATIAWQSGHALIQGESNSTSASVRAKRNFTTVTAGQSVSLQYATSNAAAANFAWHRRLDVTPIRVSA